MLSGWKFHVVLMTSIMSVWHFILTIIMVERLCINVKQQISLLIRNLGIMMNVSYSLSFAFGAIAGSFMYGTIIWWVFYVLFAVFLCLAMLTLYLLLIFRLKLSFQDSTFEISNIVLYSYYAALCICGIFSILAFILFGIEEYTKFVMSLCVTVAFGIFTDIHIAYIFNRNLFHLVSTQRQSLYVSYNSDDGCDQSPRSIELNDRQLSMVKIITKYTLIQTLGILAFAFSIILSGIITIITIHKGFSYALITCLWSMAFGLIVATYSILVSFNSMDIWYAKTCNKCHLLMKQCCIHLAEKKMDKKNEIKRQIAMQIQNTSK